MAQLFMAQVAALAKEAFRDIGSALTLGNIDSLAATATAIAWAESGGVTDAHNPDASTGDDSYGLWQINMLGSMGPRRRALFGIRSNSELLDARVNARAMVQLWVNKGRTFTDWSTYNNGGYTVYYGRAKEAVKQAKNAKIGSTYLGEGTSFSGSGIQGAVANLFDPIFEFLGQGALRVAGFVGGTALIIGAIVLVAKRGVN